MEKLCGIVWTQNGGKRLPGWILAVLPRFRFLFILLLLVVGMPTPKSLNCYIVAPT